MDAIKPLRQEPHTTGVEIASPVGHEDDPRPPEEASARAPGSAPAAEPSEGVRYRVRFACSTTDVQSPSRDASS